MFALQAQSSEDIATARRNRFWMNIWVEEREPAMNRYEGKSKDAWQYTQRNEIDEASTKYVNQLREDQALFTDPYIEDYLTQVLHRIVGSQPIAGRPGTPHILILKNIEPNAFAFNNGAILITTGMLAMIKSETELKGVLAHEVAHIVLDHNLENYNSAKSRESLAQFFGIVGAVAGGYVAAKSGSQWHDQDYYDAHLRNMVIGAGNLFYYLSKDIMDIVGAAYSRSQEEDADRIAKDYLVYVGVDPTEYGDLLFRIGNRNRIHGLSRAASLTDSHPIITSRLKDLGYTRDTPVSKTDTLYDRNIAEILTYNAALDIYESKYEDAGEHLDRAIKSGWALDDAYLLRAISLRHLATDKNTNQQALVLLEQASKIDTNWNRLIYSEKGLMYLRLHDKPNALAAFQNYLSLLSKLDQNEVQTETIWARKMIARCKMPTN
jgi:predicted Zn-dependent protease